MSLRTSPPSAHSARNSRRNARCQEVLDSMDAPDYGRVIPTPLNPNVPDMVDRVKKCYVNLTQWITGFRHDIAELADAGKLDPRERGHDRAVQRAGE